MSSKLPSTDSEATQTSNSGSGADQGNPYDSPHDKTSLDKNETNHQGGRPSPGRYALFFLPLLIGVAADLITKSYTFTNYFDPQRADPTSPLYAAQFPHWWIDGIFGIQTSTNPGALFGMGSGYSWLFASFSVVALVGILIWVFGFGAIRDRWLTFCLGMISGGILGNLYDRVGLGSLPNYPEQIQDNVRDWILFRLEGVPWFDPWPNFNIADVLLVCGAIMLFLHALIYSEPEKTQKSAVEDHQDRQSD